MSLIEMYEKTKNVEYLHMWLAENKNLIASIVMKAINTYGLKCVSSQDLIQDGYIIFYEVMPNYRSSKGAVSTYLHRTITHKLISSYKHQISKDTALRTGAISMDWDVDTDDGVSSLHEVFTKDIPDSVHESMKGIVMDLLNSADLTETHREVIMLFANGFSYREIGDQLNMSHEGARYIVEKFLAYARKELSITY